MRLVDFAERILTPVLVRRLALVFWLVLIFTLSSIPSLLATHDIYLEVITRKIAHFFEYGVLTFLIFINFARRDEAAVTRALWWTVSLALLYALSDEFHQHFVYGRHATFVDICIDGLGILVVSQLLALDSSDAKGRRWGARKGGEALK